MSTSTPERCIVCNERAPIASAGFTQLYRQHASEPFPVPWWECSQCGSWFGSPRPGQAEIERNWRATTYNDPAEEAAVAAAKQESQQLLLRLIAKHGRRTGVLLDYGCNFGRFLEIARRHGWEGVGVDAFRPGVDATRAQGFTAFHAWDLDDVALSAASLDAIVSNDVFYYVWSPHRHLRKAYDLLRPGGVFVIRTSNKRLVEGAVRAIVPRGPSRDRLLSRLLQDQFHSIAVNTLASVMTQVGYHVEAVLAGAMTAPPRSYGVPSRVLYATSRVLDRVSRGRLNISPGVYVVAQKP